VPWHLEKRGSKWAVVKGHRGESGATVGSHPSRKAAVNHLRALYANAEPGAGKPLSDAAKRRR
jgi:hypothetical protein